MENSEFGDVTGILQRATAGDRSAVRLLMPVVYGELRALAGHFLSDRTPGHTLNPTAVVHEAYVKLVGAGGIAWESRAHFFAVAAKAMRQILADHARRRSAKKRGGAWRRVDLSAIVTPAPEQADGFDLVALDEALTKLKELDPQQAEVVELRFLGGLSVEETAHVLGLSTRTVEREWFGAKAWIRRELAEG